MATNQEMKGQLLKNLSMLKKELILQQEVKLRVAVSIFQVWKNIICFLLLLASGMRGERLLFWTHLGIGVRMGVGGDC